MRIINKINRILKKKNKSKGITLKNPQYIVNLMLVINKKIKTIAKMKKHQREQRIQKNLIPQNKKDPQRKTLNLFLNN